jgi:eukaryotic-like serine/threonine-protein kinase
MRDHADPQSETASLRPHLAGTPAVLRKIDRYELRELIGCGGMGAVYRAVDTKLGRTVALKTATGKRTGARLTDRVRQRFLREAMALSKVEHRNVVQVLDFGFADDGAPFLVMEHLRGQDLGARLAEANAPLPVTEAVDIMLGVCAALRACHRVGIIHRDLKPGNIFLAETDTGPEVKVLDFGVSKAPSADDLTREGQILGTPQYLAPEQIDGKVGPASDQYALGVLLYVCLTLRLPYEDHENRALLRAIETGKFEAPRKHRPELPAELEAILLRAMHVTPSERFESVYALGQRLWDLASPRAQDEWRGYYRPQTRGPRAPAAAVLARTQILDDSPDGDADGADQGGALLQLPTRGAPSELPRPVVTPNDPWEPGELADEVASSRSRRRLAVAAIALALGSLVVFAARAKRHHAPARAGTPPATLPAPAPPSLVPPLPVPVPAPPAEPRSISPSAPAPLERAPAPEPPVARPTPPRRRPGPSRHRQAPFTAVLPNIDQFGIGIPTD